MKTFFRVIGGLQQLTVGRRNGRSSAVDARDNILLANLYQHANFHFLQTGFFLYSDFKMYVLWKIGTKKYQAVWLFLLTIASDSLCWSPMAICANTATSGLLRVEWARCRSNSVVFNHCKRFRIPCVNRHIEMLLREYANYIFAGVW